MAKTKSANRTVDEGERVLQQLKFEHALTQGKIKKARRMAREFGLSETDQLEGCRNAKMAISRIEGPQDLIDKIINRIDDFAKEIMKEPISKSRRR